MGQELPLPPPPTLHPLLASPSATSLGSFAQSSWTIQKGRFSAAGDAMQWQRQLWQQSRSCDVVESPGALRDTCGVMDSLCKQGAQLG